jgi:NAD(P)-dependent dehydrogenase (short-subunit alcohol dehydrogenase family)
VPRGLLDHLEKSMTSLAGKVCIVAGASSGIGYAAAKLFAREGARVVVAARRREELNALVAQIKEEGGEAIAVAGNVADESFAKALVETAVQRFGGLDVAFNNAGTMGPSASTPDVALADWEETVRIDLTSAFLAAKYQLPAMLARGGGSLIFTSTFVGYTVGMPGIAAYAASKSGLIGLTQALAAEFGPQGIRVNALLPGGTDTVMAREFADTPDKQAFVRSLHALKRIATPEEIARSALYLASDASSFTTGTAMLVDGGVSINRT